MVENRIRCEKNNCIKILLLWITEPEIVRLAMISVHYYDVQKSHFLQNSRILTDCL